MFYYCFGGANNVVVGFFASNREGEGEGAGALLF